MYRLLRDANLPVLVAKALSGVNPETPLKGQASSERVPATVTASESRDITKAWLTHLIHVALAKGKKVDEWRLTEEQMVQWAADLVQCFPGELVATWYSPKGEVSIEILRFQIWIAWFVEMYQKENQNKILIQQK